jgi:hypothetical protein
MGGIPADDGLICHLRFCAEIFRMASRAPRSDVERFWTLPATDTLPIPESWLSVAVTAFLAGF